MKSLFMMGTLFCLIFSAVAAASVEREVSLTDSLRGHVSQGLDYIGSQLEAFSYEAEMKGRYYADKVASLGNLLPRFSRRKSLPPVLTGSLVFQKYGNGAYPVVQMRFAGFVSDPDGSIVRVRWNFGDGTQSEFSGASALAIVRHVYPSSNHYVVSYSVEDNSGEVTTVTSYVETPENTEPSAKVLAQFDPATPLRVSYQIQGSDPESSTLTHLTASCGNVTTPTVNCTYAAPGNFNFFTRVTDEHGTSFELSSTVTLNGTSFKSTPFSVIRTNTYFGNAPLPIDFDLTASHDMDGGAVSYRWNIIGLTGIGTSGTAEKFSYTFTRPGTYVVELFTKDDENVEVRSTREIYVSPVGFAKPRIIASYNGPNAVAFDATPVAFDVPASRAGSFFWNFGGATAQGIQQFRTYSSPGTYNVKVAIFDIRGHTYFLEKNITVGSTNTSPVVAHTPSTYGPRIGQTVSFSSAGSSDPLGQPLEFRWVFDDGWEESGPVISRRFDDRGVREYQLLVTDSRGYTARGFGTVIVEDQFNGLVQNTLFDPKVGVAPVTVSFDGSTSVSDSPIVAHEWNYNGAVISRESAGTHVITTPGQHYIHHSIRNEAGEEKRTTVSLLVLAPGSIPPNNLPPVANISVSGDPATRNFGLVGVGSTDPDGYVLGHEWRVNGVKVSDNGYLNYPFTENILYHVELTVTDNWGARASAVQQFDFSPNPVPLITYDHFPLMPLVGASVRFGAESTRIPGKVIRSYSWDFGDGSSGSGVALEHTFATPGDYTVGLTVTTTDSSTYVSSRRISVAANSSPFRVVLTASAADRSGRVSEGETYRAFGAPESVQFSAEASVSSPVVIKDAAWDFGDGTSGLGVAPEHVYKKPGTYLVEVSATDWNNQTDTAQLTVVVPRAHGCYETDGETACLSDENADEWNVSPNTSSWVIGHDLTAVNFSTNPADYPAGWIKFISQDGGIASYDVAKAVTVSGNQLVIERSKLPVGLNIERPHRISVVTKSSTGAPLIAALPAQVVGLGELEISVAESGVRLEVVNPNAGIRRAIDLNGSQSITLSQLPAGQYVIVASKGNTSAVKQVQLQRGRQSVSLSVSKQLPAVRTNAKALKLRQLHQFHRGLSKRSSWSQSLCGEPSPFAEAGARDVSPGEGRVWEFASHAPMAQAKFRQVASDRGAIPLSCSIVSPGLLYAQNKWKYYEGPARCWNDERPHAYWSEYLETLKADDYPVVIKYELRDAWTNQRRMGHIITSATDLMRKHGRRLEDLSARVGLPESEKSDWGQRFDQDIPIPPHFRRPEIRFELMAQSDSSPQSPYSVTCDVGVTSSLPRLAELSAVELDGAVHSAVENGRLSLSKRYNLFPVQHDDRVSSPLALQPEIAKASYRATIRYFNRTDVEWQGIEALFRYGDKSFTKIYPFAGTPTTDSFAGVFSDSFTVDTADLKNRFKWTRGEKFVDVTFTPVGRVTADYDYRALAQKRSFTALFDLKTVKVNTPQVCPAGLYPTEYTAFVKDDLLAVLLDSFTEGAALRCGEMSAPFGGPLEISSSWKRQGHQYGHEGKIRSFNTTPGAQDNYDTFSGTALRRGDIESYMNFSNAIKNLMAIQNEEQGGQPTNKKKLVDFCNPIGGPVVAPCLEDTTFANITSSMAHELCLTQARLPDVRPPGCPMPNLNRLTRFVRWVELNRVTFSTLLRRAAFVGEMGSGQITPDSLVLDNRWQERALVDGVWPDGQSIYRLAGEEPYFTAESLGGRLGLLQKLFTYETTQLGGPTIKTEWR